jgi:hypothetical protein
LKSGCIQERSSLSSGNTTEFSEDCLYLNIFTPVLSGLGNASLPVAFWIYGGAFVSLTDISIPALLLTQRLSQTSGNNAVPEYV